MDKRNERFMSMCGVVDDLCTTEAGIIGHIPALVTAHVRLTNNITLVKGFQAISENDIKGWTTSKGVLKSTMVTKTLKLSNGISAYALATENKVLYQEVNVSKSALEAIKDEDVAVKCKLINTKGTEVGAAALEDYGLAEADFAAQAEAVDAYLAVKQKPSGKSDERETARVNIEKTIGEIRKILVLMDKLVKTLTGSQDTFVTNYFKAREIYDIGVRHEPEEPTP